MRPLCVALALAVLSGCSADVSLDWDSVGPTPTPTPDPELDEFSYVSARAVLPSNPLATSASVDVWWGTIDPPAAGDVFEVLVDGVAEGIPVLAPPITVGPLPIGEEVAIQVRRQGGQASAAVNVVPTRRAALPLFGTEPGIVFDIGNGDCFGASLVAARASGDEFIDLVIGAPFADDGSDADTGALYLARNLFSQPGDTFELLGPILADPVSNQILGYSLLNLDATGDTAGDLVAVGAPGGGGTVGRVYAFAPGGLTVIDAADEIGSLFGTSLAAAAIGGSADTFDLLVGAPLDSGGRGSFAFFLDGATPYEEYWPSILSPFPSDPYQYGFGLAYTEGFLAGTTDGFVAAGLPGGPGVFFTRAGAMDPYFPISDPEGKLSVGSELGAAVAAVDVDADGVRDILAGAPGSAEVRVIPDGHSTFVDAFGATQQIAAPLGAEEFGGTITNVGDVDGDGREDFVVGAILSDNGTISQAGAAFLYLGADVLSGATPAWTARGGSVNQYLGKSFAAADFNLDGYTDLAIGSASCFPSFGTEGLEDSAQVHFSPPSAGPRVGVATQVVLAAGTSVNVPLELSELGVGGRADCEWDTGAGFSEAAPCPGFAEPVTYDEPGDYFLRVRVTTPYGHSTESVLHVRVQ